MNNFLESSDCRETSQEIIDAIALIANGSEELAERIWAAPSDQQMQKIIRIVTENGKIDTTEFCWGAAGSRWAQ
jgi:hypothetical protein